MKNSYPAKTVGNTYIEAEILIACAASNLDPAQSPRIREVVCNNAVDWDLLLKTALDHGVMPLLHCGLNSTCPELIPPEIALQLNQHAQNNARHNLLLIRELVGLLAGMSAAGVHVLPYKGPLLAMAAYGDLTLRQCGDLDLLVPKKDLPAAKAVLGQKGYRPDKVMTAAEESAFEASTNEYHHAFVRQNPATMVEVHWKITGDYFCFNPDPLELWNRASTQTVAGAELRVLQPEDSLLVLCAHGAKHFWSRLTWICDIAQFLKAHPSLNWDIVLSRAGEHDAKGMLFLALLLANGLLGIKLAETVTKEIGKINRAQALDIQNRLFLQSKHADLVPKGAKMQLNEGGMFESLLFQFRMRHRWSGKLSYCLHRAIVPNHVDRSWVRLPRPMHIAYYLIRPLRLFVKYSLRPAIRLTSLGKIGFPQAERTVMTR